MMPRKPMGEELALDMSYSEAMERFIAVDPREMEDNIARSKKKKPPGGKRKKRAPPGKKAKAENVVDLRQRRMRRRGALV